MAGIVDLKVLLQDMQPCLEEKEYVFCTKKVFTFDSKVIELSPIATFQEEEGMTLIIEREKADEYGLSYEGVFNKITLKVYSSLEAVGLTATFASALAKYEISVNVVAGYYQDHIFVPVEKASLALKALQELSE